MKPFISIIIPCYNDAEYIEQAVQSAVNQKNILKEIIVVDDGSDSKTKLVLKNLFSYVDNLITQENQGASTARNKGIEKAKGEFIIVLDSDDFLDPYFGERAYDILKTEENVKLVSSYIRRFNEDGTIDIIKPDDAFIDDVLKNSCATGNVMFRKKDFIRCSGYDESMRNGFEDWEFYIRLLKDGGEARVIKAPLINYRKKNSSTSTRANKIKYDLLRYIYKKHKDLYILNYDTFIDHLLNRLETVEKSEKKMYEKIEYRVGRVILEPIRTIKNFLR